MRLNLNEIVYELEKDIEEFARFERPGRGAEARVRAPHTSRSRSDAPEGRSRSGRVRTKDQEEDSL